VILILLFVFVMTSPGYAETREAAMTTFAKGRRQE